MSWIKLMLGLVTIAFCVFLGYLASAKYRNRKNYFSQMNSFNEKYLNELTFSKKPLTDFYRENTYQGDFEKTITTLIKNRNVEVEFSYLTQDEKNFCAEYFQMIGTGDARSQQGYFSAQAQVLQAKKEDAHTQAKKMGDLYLKLGLLAGLAFVILIV